MAADPPKPSRSLELFLFLGLIVVGAGTVLYGAARMLQGVAPIAEQGANVAKPSDLVFYVFAGMAIVSGAGVAFSKNIIHSAIALLGALLSAGALYVFLGAEYVAVTQLLIYVGGVLVLILFAVMLTHRIDDKKHSNPSVGVLPGIGLLAALVLMLGFVATKAPWKVADNPPLPTNTAATIGDAFLGHYLLPFEIASLVLLATLIGAVVVARKEIKE